MLCRIASGDDVDSLRSTAEDQGMGWSALGPMYAVYDREEFIAALNDWGWTGQGTPPEWYTGEPWTD